MRNTAFFTEAFKQRAFGIVVGRARDVVYKRGIGDLIDRQAGGVLFAEFFVDEEPGGADLSDTAGHRIGVAEVEVA